MKIKRLLEENIRLKLRIRDLIELTKDLEKENDRNIDRFKNYISSLPIDENLKKDINSKLETMFG